MLFRLHCLQLRACRDGPLHPPGIFIEYWHPLKDLVLNENYGGIHTKELTLGIHPNSGLGQGYTSVATTGALEANIFARSLFRTPA